MLSGVSFRSDTVDGSIQPEFVNKYILTDVYQSSKTNHYLRTPILPSITTLVNPLSSLIAIMLRILRTVTLVILSHLPGSMVYIKRISVANTAVLYHDGRALATCESGPPMRIKLPSLETIGWYDGITSEGELDKQRGPGFGGGGNSMISFMREWTTAHVFMSSIITMELGSLTKRSLELTQRPKSSYYITRPSSHPIFAILLSHRRMSHPIISVMTSRNPKECLICLSQGLALPR